MKPIRLHTYGKDSVPKLLIEYLVENDNHVCCCGEVYNRSIKSGKSAFFLVEDGCYYCHTCISAGHRIEGDKSVWRPELGIPVGAPR